MPEYTFPLNCRILLKFVLLSMHDTLHDLKKGGRCRENFRASWLDELGGNQAHSWQKPNRDCWPHKLGDPVEDNLAAVGKHFFSAVKMGALPAKNFEIFATAADQTNWQTSWHANF